MYRVNKVAGWGLTECPADRRVVARGPAGYLAHLNGHVAVGTASPPSLSLPVTLLPRIIGTESCPWTVVVHPGQTVSLRVIVLPPESTTGSSSTTRGTGGSVTGGGGGSAAARVGSAAAAYFVSSDLTGGGTGCATAFVIREPVEIVSSFEQTRHRQQYSVCAGSVGGKSRERHLYTSAGNTVTVHVASTRGGSGQRHAGGRRRSAMGESSLNPASDPTFNIRFIISYEGEPRIACVIIKYCYRQQEQHQWRGHGEGECLGSRTCSLPSPTFTTDWDGVPLEEAHTRIEIVNFRHEKHSISSVIKFQHSICIRTHTKESPPAISCRF